MQPFRQLRARGETAGTQVMDDLEESIGTAHVFIIWMSYFEP